MAVTINADTTNGLVLTPDTSGEISFQSNGTTVAGMNSTGWTGDGSQLSGVGKILQVVNVWDRNTSSYTGVDIANPGNYGFDDAGFDLTTLDATITPSSTSSKILILTNISVGGYGNYFGVMRLKRGINGATPSFSSTDDWISSHNNVVGVHSRAGSSIITKVSGTWDLQPIHFQWLDSPNTTNEVKYRFNISVECDNGTTLWLNRNAYTTNDYGGASFVSSVTLMEVAG